ncbi:amino acid ABC transporter permease [Lichenifustis flavocetrariae]|uniref:Amino acid ABC transporter permease n=1 Tax=Lichenifustis flavocetrariae TaxID=2949735 RepID=A0AA41Z1U5_9HYPH|nr:amino acid ABC transporter permease [Lichenifustis flavocetrariae]MCW6512174.1 amino acid ABC transporter permease [Lichenifustis flavocetrariae]
MHLNFSVWLTRWPYLLQGAAISLEIVVIVLLLSTPLAMIAALGLGATNRAILYPMMAISWILRGIPPLVILFVAYFVVPQFGISLTPLVAAIAGFTAYNTLVVAELIVAGFRSVDPGQHAAIAALGLPPFRAYRRVLLPQALPSIIPPYISYSTDMVKGTALAGSIGVLELVTRANQVILATNRPFEILLGIAALYGIVDAGLMGLQAAAERLWAPHARR